MLMASARYKPCRGARGAEGENFADLAEHIETGFVYILRSLLSEMRRLIKIMNILDRLFAVRTRNSAPIYKSATFINFCSVFHHA